MSKRSWPILAMGFGILLGLIAFFGVETIRRFRGINDEIATLQQKFQSSDRVLSHVRAQVYLSGILIRDFLLDSSNPSNSEIKMQLMEIRYAITQQLNQIEPQLDSIEAELLRHLRREIDLYLQSMDPIFSWTTKEKTELSTPFLKRQVLPRRQSVLSITDQIRKVNESNFERQRNRVSQSARKFNDSLLQMTAISLVLGVGVSFLSIMRLHYLESLTEEQQQQSEQSKSDLRRLSQQLVKAQEDERKLISRELHDEVGQLLTGVKMELANLEKLRGVDGPYFEEHLEAARTLGGKALDGVRNLAMGLRPSMLDDLGLVPAIQWQSKEFSKRSGIPVDLQIDGELERISDYHRTCIYRVVQEALTNCARHSQARNVYVSLHGQKDCLWLAIRDDGLGFDRAAKAFSGMGLIGIEERVKELHGSVEIMTQPQKGTLLQIKLPYHPETDA